MRFALVLLLGAVTLSAHVGPDFSGRWALESPVQPTTDFAREFTVRVGQPRGRLNERGEPVEPDSTFVAVVRTWDTGSRSETYDIGRFHGVVPGVREDGTSGPVHRLDLVTWRGGGLEFTRNTFTGREPGTGVWDERRESWSLDPDGRLRVTITTRSSSAAPTSAAAVYRRARGPIPGQ